jgi:hypothetical protein
MKFLIKNLFGSPLRFFAGLSILFGPFIIFSFFPLDNLSVYRYQQAPFYFWGLGILLYLLAVLTKDLSTPETSIRRLWGSPVKIVAMVVLLFAYYVFFFSILWLHLKMYPFYLSSIGLLLYLIDYIVIKQKVGQKAYVLIQSISVLAVILGVVLVRLYQTAETIYIIPNSAKKEVIIVYGVEGYPPLNRSFFWRKSIHIPDTGLLITSSLISEVPGYRKFYVDEVNRSLKRNNLFIQDVCENNNVMIVAQYITPRQYYPYIPFDQSDVQRKYQQLYDSICAGELVSRYIDTRDARFRGPTRDSLKVCFKQLSK